MQILRQKISHLVLMTFPDDAPIALDESGLRTADLTVTDVSSSSHEVAMGEGPVIPIYWVPHALAFNDGVWAISDQAAYDAGLPLAKAEHQRGGEAEAILVRADRTERLADSDWTQLADAPVDQAAWATYRQALRDVTAQAGFPWTVTWPDAP